MGFEGIATQTVGESPVAILAPYGEITSENVLEMQRTIDALLGNFTHLVIDLTHAAYVSSAGWRALIDRCRQGRQPIRVAGMHSTVRDAYDLLGLSYVITAHETVSDAIAAFNAERDSRTQAIPVATQREPT
jgi:anti-anti-sigma factor